MHPEPEWVGLLPAVLAAVVFVVWKILVPRQPPPTDAEVEERLGSIRRLRSSPGLPLEKPPSPAAAEVEKHLAAIRNMSMSGVQFERYIAELFRGLG